MKQRITINGRFGVLLAWLFVKVMGLETKDVTDEPDLDISFNDYFYWRNEGFSDGAAGRRLIRPLDKDGFPSDEHYIAMCDAYTMGYAYGQAEFLSGEDEQDED